jgi:hypothetical protein
MGYYRLYSYELTGKISEFHEFLEDNDEKAIELCRNFFPHSAIVELWQGARLVTTFERSK